MFYLETRASLKCNTSRSTAFFFLACSYSSRTTMFSNSIAAVATQQWGTLKSASVTSRTPLILAQLLNSRIPTAFSPPACETSPDKDVIDPARSVTAPFRLHAIAYSPQRSTPVGHSHHWHNQIRVGTVGSPHQVSSPMSSGPRFSARLISS